MWSIWGDVPCTFKKMCSQLPEFRGQYMSIGSASLVMSFKSSISFLSMSSGFLLDWEWCSEFFCFEHFFVQFSFGLLRLHPLESRFCAIGSFLPNSLKNVFSLGRFHAHSILPTFTLSAHLRVMLLSDSPHTLLLSLGPRQCDILSPPQPLPHVPPRHPEL